MGKGMVKGEKGWGKNGKRMGKESGKGRRRRERREIRVEKLGKGKKGRGKTRGNLEKMYGMWSNKKNDVLQ